MTQRATTPTDITDEIRSFCLRINSEAEPVVVPVDALDIGEHKFCNLNVAAKIAQDGGSQVCGWCLWLTPGLLIEGEAHMVWKSPDGRLVDVSPKPDGEKQIVFLPAVEDFSFDQPIPNKRQALVDSMMTRFVIRQNCLMDELRAKYWAGAIGALIPLQEEQRLMNDLGNMYEALVVRGDTHPTFFCPCKSGKKYGKCCGRPLGSIEPYTNF